MAQFTFSNPVALPPNMNAAEKMFAKCMAEGKPCVIGKHRPAKAISEGADINVIRAELICFFACGGDRDNPIKGGAIFLQGAFVTNWLNLTLVSLPYALNLMDCYFYAPFPVTMYHSVLPSLNLSGSYLPLGLHGDGMRINGSMFIDKGFVAEGEVRLPGVNIGGELECGGGTFKNKDGKAFFADGINVGGNIFMSNNFVAEGEVCLLDANIGRGLRCNNSTFKNTKGFAIAGDRMKVGGNITLNDGFAAEGIVRFLNADVGGLLHCDGGMFRGGSDGAFLAEGIRVKGNVLMRDGFCAEGGVLLLDANINGLHCGGGKFKNGLNARAAKIRNTLCWKDVDGKGTVDLSFAAVDVLEDDEKSRKNFDFLLGGFSYQRFESPGEIESRIEKWLDKRPDGADFSPQPFEQAAKVLFAMGHNNDARKVLWTKEQRLTEEGELPDWHKPLRKVWDWLAGYGYRLRRTLFWSAGIVLAGMVMFNFADHTCRIVPHQPVVLASKAYINAKPERCVIHRQPTKFVEQRFTAYPRFEPLFYSLDVFIPFFALHMESHWYPQSEDGDTDIALRLLRLWYWIEIIAGWVLTSLLVLSITGFLKPRQSSLE